MKRLFRKIRFWFLKRSIETRLKSERAGLCYYLRREGFGNRFYEFINANYEFKYGSYLYPLKKEYVPNRMKVLETFLATELVGDKNEY